MSSGNDLFIRVNLDNTPPLAAELGNMCAAWAAVEFRIFTIFEAVSATPVPIARAIFYSHFNFTSRIRLLLAVAGMVFRNEDGLTAEYTALDKLLGKITKSSKKRNQYIHDPYAARDAVSAEVTQLRLGGDDIHGEAKEVTKKDLEQLTNQLNEWTRRLHAYYRRVLPLLPALHGKLDKSRIVTLVSSNPSIPQKRNRAGQQPPHRSSQE
jgi:hypothetical protein